MNNDNGLLIPDDDTPQRADARRNRDLLLNTALSLFAASGVDAVSMTAIAEAAGVGKGTLYRHFANKTDLCHALLDEDMRELQMQVLAYLRDHTNPLENLQWFMGRILGFVERNEALLVVEDVSRMGITLDHPAHYWWRQTIMGLLAQLRPDEDVRYAADMLYLMLDVRTLRFQRDSLGYSMDEIRDGLKRAAAQLARAS